MPRRLLPTIAFLLVLASAARAQQRPLRTEDPEPIPAHHTLIELGVDLELERSFPIAGLEGDVLGPSLGFSFGFGSYAEFQVDGGYDLLFVESRRPAPFADMLDFTGDTTSDIDDPIVATKIRLQHERAYRPAVGLRFAARFPSASNESGLGTDTIDLFLTLLAGKSVGTTRLVANFGMGVLSDPLRADRQNDVLTGGLSAAHEMGRWTLVGEANGRLDVKGRAPPGTEDRGEVRLGARYELWEDVRLDSGLIVGLADPDADVGLTVGVTAMRKTF